MNLKDELVRLSPPWHTYQRKVFALFGRDPEVLVRDLVEVDECNYTLIIISSNQVKAEAISALLGRTVKISGVTITIRIFGPDSFCEVEPPKQIRDAQLLEDAFQGNPIFDRIAAHSFHNIQIVYCIFKKEVLQFWNDDLSSFYGVHSTLAEILAYEILKNVKVQFCTSIK